MDGITSGQTLRRRNANSGALSGALRNTDSPAKRGVRDRIGKEIKRDRLRGFAFGGQTSARWQDRDFATTCRATNATRRRRGGKRQSDMAPRPASARTTAAGRRAKSLTDHVLGWVSRRAMARDLRSIGVARLDAEQASRSYMIRKTMTRILIVEDNEDLAFGLRRTLEDEGYAVEVAADGLRGSQRARDDKPDLVILDLMLPGMDGYRTLESIRGAGLQMPVIILTARGEEADKVHGFRVGADDYVTKPFGLSELLARVSAQLRRSRLPGGSGATSERYAFSDIEIVPSGRIVTKGGDRVALTPREYDLLLALVQRPGIVLSRVTLLREVWGHQADVMTRTVDIHMGELRKKLENVAAEPRHFMTVWKAGYRFDP